MLAQRPSVVLRVLDLSKSHISKTTISWLEAQARDQQPWILTVAQYRGGFFIRIPTDDIEGDVRFQQCPSDLRDIFAIARQAGCRVVCPDGEADLHPLLPQHDW